MTDVTISPSPIMQFFDNSGNPAVGGSVLTTVGGVITTCYQDSDGTVPLPNPIPLNSRGEISNAAGASCQLFLQTGIAYTFTLFDSSGNQLNQAQYVATPTALSANSIGTLLYPQTAAELAANVMPTVISYQPGDPRRYGATGNGIADDTNALTQCFSCNQIVNFPGPSYTFGISANIPYSITNGVINGNGSVIQPLAGYSPPNSGTMANVQANFNFSNCANVTVQNLTFNGSVYNGASAQNYAILFQGTLGGVTTGCKVLCCTFIEYPDPVGACIGFYTGSFEHLAYGNRSLQCHGTVFSQGARCIIDSNIAENPGDTSFVIQGQGSIGCSIINNKVYNPSGNAQNSIGIEEGPSDWVVTGNYVEGLTGAGIYMYNNVITTSVRGGVIANNIIDGGGASITPSGIVTGILMTPYYANCDIHDNIVKNIPPTVASSSALAILYQTNSRFHDNDLDATSASGLVTAVSINPTGAASGTPTVGTLDIIDNRLNNTGGGRGYMLGAGAFGSQRIAFYGGEIISGSVGIDANNTSNSGADIWVKDVLKITSSTPLNVSGNYTVLADFQTFFNAGAQSYPHSIRTLGQTVMYGSAIPAASTGVQNSIVLNLSLTSGAHLLWFKSGSSTWTASSAVF